MILVRGRFIYLATPATASRSTTRVLVDQCGGEILNKTHHAYLSDMPILDDYTEPVYSMIRNPYEYVLSRYHYKYKTQERRKLRSPEDFVRHYALESHGHDFGSIMCMYRNHVDRFFLFEDGLKAFFDTVGFPNVDIPKEGMHASNRILDKLTIEDVSEAFTNEVEKHFGKELELYNSCAKG